MTAMSHDCPHCGSASPAFKAVSDAVLAIAEERSTEGILQKIVDAARELAGGRYAALGVPDGAGGFARFITSGMDDATIEAIGPLPRTHGLLDATLVDPKPYRTGDVQGDPRFKGWPDEHPDMRSFLGVPIVLKDRVIGAFYLTDKRTEREFSEADQQLIEMLAAHAAIAIENARLYERSRELSVVEERNRLARELHDSVSQTLFSVTLTAEAAATLVDRDPGAAKVQIRRLQELARDTSDQMRSLIFELRPAELRADGLIPTLRKHVEVLRRVHHLDVELDVEVERRFRAPAERELFRIAQEALNNVIKHAQARRVRVRVSFDDNTASMSIADDGVGFDPRAAGVRSKRLGLTSMEERAQELGGTMQIVSSPGAGTTLRVEVPLVR